MKVINIHSREYKASTREVGLLLDTLSSMNDLLWPHHSWPMMYCPLHDALIEDSLTSAEAQLGLEPKISEWSTWVKLFRWVVSGGKSGPQELPHSSRQKGRYNWKPSRNRKH